MDEWAIKQIAQLTFSWSSELKNKQRRKLKRKEPQ